MPPAGVGADDRALAESDRIGKSYSIQLGDRAVILKERYASLGRERSH